MALILAQAPWQRVRLKAAALDGPCSPPMPPAAPIESPSLRRDYRSAALRRADWRRSGDAIPPLFDQGGRG